MSFPPRFALGTIQPEADSTAVACALLDVLERRDVRVQCFLSRACFASIDGAGAITGQSARHFDTWLMPRALCLAVLQRGTASGSWGLVQGKFRSALMAEESAGGDLETLCDWLDLPRLAIVDVSRLGNCKLPDRPERLDGLVLDRVRSSDHACRLQTRFESLWGVPVLGCLEELPALRCWLRSLPGGSQPPRELCHELGQNFMRRSQVDRVCRLASRRELPGETESPPPVRHVEKLHVAMAYDEVFRCYFPDVLDLLELSGATVSDFSPLHDERLPPQTDLVYFGCGHPERFARQLAENHCMTMALLNHLCSGRRIYAEGGGLAYLCRDLETADGERTPMVGVFPATAKVSGLKLPPRAVELPLAAPNWFGPAGTPIRGYVNSHWTIVPGGLLKRYSAVPGHEWDLVGRNQAIGSRLHLNFAAQGAVFDALFAPHAAPDEPLQSQPLVR